jgi:hypothetical protein
MPEDEPAEAPIDPEDRVVPSVAPAAEPPATDSPATDPPAAELPATDESEATQPVASGERRG